MDGAPAPISQPLGELPIPPPFHPVDRLGFYVDGGEQRQPHGLMEKLMLMRRKSLKYAPKVGSPLGKSCQWADY